MATPKLITVREFNTSRFSQLADNSDANIGDVISRAEAAIESKLRRPIAPTKMSEIFTPNSSTVYLSGRPVISIENIWRSFRPMALSGDAPIGATVVSGYILKKAQGVLEFASNLGGHAMRVDYTAGFENIPEDIKEAVILQTALFLHQDLEIYGSGDSKEPGILYYKRDIDELLRPYKQLNMAYTS